MTQFLAPYNNAMRLGQGFNSYTQQICLDRAVLPDLEDDYAAAKKQSVVLARSGKAPQVKQDPETSSVLQTASSTEDSDNGLVLVDEQKPDYADEQRTHVTGGSGHTDSDDLEVQTWVKPQIVTYSSRFVDKLSDVTGARSWLHQDGKN